jgi:hypothetical protein
MMPSRVGMRSGIRQEEGISQLQPHMESPHQLHSPSPSQTQRGEILDPGPPSVSSPQAMSSPVKRSSPPAPTSYSPAVQIAPSPSKQPVSQSPRTPHTVQAAAPSPATQFFPSTRGHYLDEQIPYHSPRRAPVLPMHFEQEVVHVKTRGTSPFSSRDFDSLFSDSIAAPAAAVTAVPSTATPRHALQSTSHYQTPRQPREGRGATVTEVEAATIRILESQTKAQEASGDMIGKFTTLIAELGKIITHREQPSVNSRHKTSRGKRRALLDESGQRHRPHLPVEAVPNSTALVRVNVKSGVGVSGVPKKSARAHREEILDHILQRLQVSEPTPSSALGSLAHSSWSAKSRPSLRLCRPRVRRAPPHRLLSQ